MPRWAAIEDGDRVAADDCLDADLVAKAGWDPGSAVLADLGDVGVWRCGHTTTLGPNLLTVTVTVTVSGAAHVGRRAANVELTPVVIVGSILRRQDHIVLAAARMLHPARATPRTADAWPTAAAARPLLHPTRRQHNPQ